MNLANTSAALPRDPRDLYSQPPFRDQKPIDMPGSTAQMKPQPDHGEKSYVGHDRFRGWTALITGSDSGIGRAVAIAYAREGANLLLSGLSESQDLDDAREICQQAGVDVQVQLGDLRDEAFCDGLVRQAVDHFGRLDILVNNAAHQATRDSMDAMDTAMFDRVMKTNLYGTFWMSRAALPHLPAGGSIINTASIQGYDPSGMLLPYAMTKSALLGFTKALAELAIKQGVRVNAVAPGPVWTPLIPGSMPPEKVEKFGSNSAFERPAQPAELAPLYVWLASPEASYVTAEVYGATGGRSPV